MNQLRVFDTPTDSSDPIRALIAAILQRALDDLHLGEKDRAGVMAWVNQTGCQQRPGSFEWCCDALSLHPDAVRRKYRDEVTCIRASPAQSSKPQGPLAREGTRP